MRAIILLNSFPVKQRKLPCLTSVIHVAYFVSFDMCDAIHPTPFGALFASI